MAEQLIPGSSLLGRPDGPEFRRKSAAPRRPTMRRTTATPWASPSSQTRSRRSGSFHELVRFVMRCEHICERWRGVDVLGVVKFDLRRRLHTIILPISQSSIPPKIPRQLQFATSPLRSFRLDHVGCMAQPKGRQWGTLPYLGRAKATGAAVPDAVDWVSKGAVTDPMLARGSRGDGRVRQGGDEVRSCGVDRCG